MTPDITAVLQNGGISLSFTGLVLTQTGPNQFLLTTPIAQARAPGVLFDTDAGDKFTDLIYAPDATLTVAATGVVFSSPTASNHVMTVSGKDAVTPLYFAFDHHAFDAAFHVTSFANAGDLGVELGARYYVSGSSDGVWGAMIQAHPGSAAQALVQILTGGAGVGTYSSAGAIALPADIRVRASHDQTANTLTVTVNVNGGSDHVDTFPYTSGSFAANTRMVSPVLRFRNGTISASKFKFSAAYPGARFAFIGNSLTIWPGTVSGSPSGFAHLIRADYSPASSTLIAGASGSTTEDMVLMAESIVRMAPKVVIWTAPAVNDRVLGWTVSRSIAAVNAVLARFDAAGIPVVFTNDSPIGNSDVPVFNAQLVALGRPVIDIYTSLLGSGVSLKPAFNSGDGIHWTDAGGITVNGHLVVKGLIETYITANGL